MDMVNTATIKLRRLPMPLVQEVNNFIDFLILKNNNQRWQAWTQFTESLSLAESDFSDYLSNLEAYEERLAKGEIQW
jgi:LPS O-antigen subunit length determinant protein (WzzB/FepE family)